MNIIYVCLKMTRIWRKIILVLAFFGLLGCVQKKAKAEEEVLDKKAFSIQKNEVDVQILKQQAFKRELVSNGKLVAVQKNILKFEVSERLEQLNVKNGDAVERGQLLAALRPYRFQQELHKAKSNLQKTILDFKDQLLGRGYDFDVRDSIPDKIYDMVAIRTGYQDAQRLLEEANHNFKSTQLLAPFSGRVANIVNKKFEQIGAGRDFMTLIDDSVFEVEFYLIESEIGDVNVGDQVEIMPFSNEEYYQGKITTINPLVEKNGTILVKASVKNDGQLMEGMNVKVLIQKDIPNQFVVPKNAVVLRQNQEVLFKVVNGKAYWTYVLTIHENSKHYSVVPNPDKSSASLAIGDSIIVSGNLNLAHDSEVEAKRNVMSQ